MDATLPSEIFQALVFNNHMIPYGRWDYYFSFQTVFHFSKYFTYCMCPCAYEHENFDYVSETGEINHEMFQKIVDSIRTGACPHVNMVPEECVTSTTVLGIHIVAAMGSEERILCYLQNMYHKPIHDFYLHRHDPVMISRMACITEQFKHTPYSIALLKNKAVVNENEFKVFFQFRNKGLVPNDYELYSLIHGFRDSENSNKVKIQTKPMIEISLQQQNMAMLKCITTTLLPIAKPSSIAKVYEAVYRHNKEHELLHEIYSMMITKLKGKQLQSHHDEVRIVAKTLIVCDLPDLLDNLINELDIKLRCNYICPLDMNPYTSFASNCIQTCRSLHRPECENVLNRYYRSETLESLNYEQEGWNNTTELDQKYLPMAWERNPSYDYKDNNVFIEDRNICIKLMNLLYNHPFSKDTIQRAFQLIPNLHKAIHIRNAKELRSPLQYEDYEPYILRPEGARLLIDNGADIDIRRFGKSVLFKTWNINLNTTIFENRQLLELFLYSNPSLDDDHEGKTFIARGISIDARLLESDGRNFTKAEYWNFGPQKYVCHKVIPGTYLMDARVHSFLYKDCSDIPLNFTVPLLIESGFPIQSGQIEKALGKSLQPAIKAYLQQCLRGPRSLQGLCRDRLRTHYKGRKIHTYVHKMNIPKPVSDFILLKTILPTISHDEWSTIDLREFLLQK